MEELQAIETTTGRQFKPWVDADKLQQIVSDPASVTGITSEIVSGKQAIAEAINAKGGSASATESFKELADDIDTIPNAIDWVKMVCEREYNTNSIDNTNPIKSIERVTSNTTTFIGQYAFKECTQLQYVDMPNVTSLGICVFEGCAILETVELPNVVSIGVRSFAYCTNLKGLSLPNWSGSFTTSYSYFFAKCLSLEYLLLPKITGLSNTAFGGAQGMGGTGSLKRLQLGTLSTTLVNLFIGGTYGMSVPYLISFEIGAGSDYDILQNGWNPTPYFAPSAEQWPNRLQLYTNLKEHLIDRLYDHSEDGVDTRVLRIGFYATLYADSQLVDEPYGSYYTPLIKAMAQACITTCGQKLWTISA